MYFDASNPYHRYMLHYESDNQLSVPELIARGSVDATTAATIWYLIEHRASYMIAGPTDPTPGVGKTTTLNALLPFYPEGTGLVYTMGMYETFDFKNETVPQETTVLANEVSDHLRIYMWGRVARQLIDLPGEGYAIATSCHADTLPEVVGMLTDTLRIPAARVRHFQIIVNIGLHGRSWPQKRRWLTTTFIPPVASDETPTQLAQVPTLSISCWDKSTDTFQPAEPETIAAMAKWTGDSVADFTAGVARRQQFLSDLADQGADIDATLEALAAFRKR